MGVHGGDRGCVRVGCYWAGLSSRIGTFVKVGGTVGWW